MSKPILKFDLEPKIYKIDSKSSPFQQQIDDLKISEDCSSNSEYEKLGEGFGDYKISIEKVIDNSKSLQNAHFDISTFIREIDKAWMYACGHPLTKKDFAFMAPHINFPDGKVPGWNSNYNEVEKELDRGKAHISVSFKNMHNSSFSYWPLKVALDIRKKYLQATEQVQALIDLHYYSHKVNDGYSMLFFLAKSLELVHLLLPGKNNSKKEQHLPSEVREKLISSLDHMFNLSNNRYEIRHIVKDKKNSILHSKLTNKEIETFKMDADMIIRTVVCMNLGITLFLSKS